MRTCNPARRRLSRNSLPGSPRRFASSLRLRSASGRAKLGTPRTSELIDHPQSLELLPVRTAIEHEVVRINMVRVAGGKGSRSSRCISSSRPEAGHVYHCLLSEQIRPVGAHRKPRRSKKHLDPAVSESGILCCQLAHRRKIRRIAHYQPRLATDCRSRDLERRARPAKLDPA